MAVFHEAVNHPPVILPVATYSMHDGPTDHGKQALVVHDIDGAPEERLSLTLSCDKGVLILTTADELTVEAGAKNLTRENATAESPSSVPGSSQLRLVGTSASLNRGMRGLRYRGLPDMRGHDEIRVTLADDPPPCPGDDWGTTNTSTPSERNVTTASLAPPCPIGGPRTTEATIRVYLSPVNRPPLIHVPRGGENTRTAVDASTPANLGDRGQLWIEDPDVRETVYYSAGGLQIEGPVTVDIAADHGRLTLGMRGGLTMVLGQGISDAAVRFSGAIDDANRALAALSYRCAEDNGCRPGEHRITVSVDDNGFTGKGGPMNATASFSVHVSAADSPA